MKNASVSKTFSNPENRALFSSLSYFFIQPLQSGVYGFVAFFFVLALAKGVLYFFEISGEYDLNEDDVLFSLSGLIIFLIAKLVENIKDKEAR